MREPLRNCHIGRRIVARGRGLLGNQRGVSLVEVLVAIAILGIVASAYLTALASSSRTQNVNQELASAAHLAQSQMEYVMSESYAASYTPASIPSQYYGYSVTIDVTDVSSRDATLQKICVTVSHGDKLIILADGCTLASYKVQT